MTPTAVVPDADLTSGSEHSYWIDSVEAIRYSPLDADISTQVVIVGAGISGLSVAYNLVSQGRQVVLIEDGNIGSGETGRTTAHIASALDDRYYEIERVFGRDGAKLAAESHSAAIRWIETVIDREGIKCDFGRLSGFLFLHPTDKAASLQKEFEAASRAGLHVSQSKTIPGLKTSGQGAIEFHDQAQFHPLKYLRGLAEAVIRKGGRIFTQTRATKISSKAVEANGFTISAEHIVVATNSPVNDRFVMHMKQFPFRTYVIGATVKKESLPKALWWDTGDFDADPDMAPYHYARLQPYNDRYDLLIVGGEDHNTGLPEAMKTSGQQAFAKLEHWTRERFDIQEVVYRWSGQVLEPMDSLGFIGRNPMDKDNVYIVTGDSGNGMTHGTIAGMLIGDLIAGKENPWEKIYDPGRLHVLKTGKTFIREFVGGFFDYLKTKPRNAGDVHLDDIAAGDAGIVELGRHKYGAYRDEERNLHLVSATCTHLGCTVKWNATEKSWDCPCHGSRFNINGQVLNGPAIEGLAYLKEAAEAQLPAVP